MKGSRYANSLRNSKNWELSKYAYDKPSSSDSLTINGVIFTVENTYRDDLTGLNAILVKNESTQEYTISYSGSDERIDWALGSSQIIQGKLSPQVLSAQTALAKFRSEAKAEDLQAIQNASHTGQSHFQLDWNSRYSFLVFYLLQYMLGLVVLA